MKGKFILLISLLLAGYGFAKAQNEFIDTMPAAEDEIISGFGNNLDSLLNLWYVNQTIQLEDVNNMYLLEEDTQVPDFSDSVYIDRLSRIPSVIELSYNRIVKNFIDLYTKQRRERVSVMLTLSDFYFPLIEEVMDRYQLPYELKYLAIIESALNPRAVSRVGATGMWQFMYSTGRHYGLNVNSLVDDRRDPYKATVAAAEFLTDLYKIYGDWILVIAAYNCGPGNVNKAIRRSGGKKNYWDIYYNLPRETRGYVPAFIAASYVMNYHKEHNLFPVAVDFELNSDTFIIKDKLHLKQVSEVLGISITQLRDLNPQYKYDIIPADDKEYVLRIPQIQTARFIDLQDSIFAYHKDELFNDQNRIISPTSSSNHIADLPSDKYTKLYYTVRSGDNLGFISTWYNVRLSDIRYWNNIRSNVIRSGQKLVIYVPNSKADNYKGINTMTFAQKQRGPGNTTSTVKSSDAKNEVAQLSSGDNEFYTVREGDSLWEIAKKYPGVSDSDIARINNLTKNGSIKPGQVLKIK